MYVRTYVQKCIKYIFMTDPPPVYNTTISSSITPVDLSGFDIIISWMVSMLIDIIIVLARLLFEGNKFRSDFRHIIQKNTVMYVASFVANVRIRFCKIAKFLKRN